MRSVLVHCAGGISRSAAVTLAYMMRGGGWVLREAFRAVQDARPIIAPNSGLVNSLIDYEIRVRGGASTMRRPLSIHQRGGYSFVEKGDAGCVRCEEKCQ